MYHEYLVNSPFKIFNWLTSNVFFNSKCRHYRFSLLLSVISMQWKVCTCFNTVLKCILVVSLQDSMYIRFIITTLYTNIRSKNVTLVDSDLVFFLRIGPVFISSVKSGFSQSEPGSETLLFWHVGFSFFVESDQGFEWAQLFHRTTFSDRPSISSSVVT